MKKVLKIIGIILLIFVVIIGIVFAIGANYVKSKISQITVEEIDETAVGITEEVEKELSKANAVVNDVVVKEKAKAREAVQKEFADKEKNLIEAQEKEVSRLKEEQEEKVNQIEKEHEERFRKLLDNVKTEKVFAKDQNVIWICKNCGHIHIGEEAPKVCAICKYEQSYFEVKAENY